MKTTFLTLMAATLAATTLTGCKKDSGDDDNVIRFTDPNLSVAVNDTAQVKLFVPSGSGIADIKSNNTQVAIAGKTTNYLFLNIIGVKEGNTTVEVKNGNRTQKAVLNVHVFKEDIAENGGFKVDKSTIFLKKNGETDVTSHIRGGSGNYDVSIRNSNLGSVRKDGGKFIVTGLEEGFTDVITFKDLTKNINIDVEAYVIKPFKAVGAPTELVQNSVYNITLDGVYTTTTAVNGRFDRVQMNVTGGAVTAQFITKDVKTQNGVKQGEEVIGIKVTAKNVGTGTVNLINGDGQPLSLNFTVKALVADNYFDVNNEGVATVKPGVTLPSHVTLPANAKKIAREAFKNQNNLESVNLMNVEVIDQDAFMGCSKLATVEMPIVKVIEGGAFRASGLKDVVLPASLQKIERGAFDTPAVQNVTCKATTPPTIDPYAFRTSGGTNRKLYVPAGSIESYYNDSAWRNVLTSRAFDGLKTNGYKPLPIQ
ncbi:leucine-rich repeat domain-containing protein [Capnocytophaga sputigena]|uniref:leucine-rich repeat domain-containing protein n=1 Tax=Capnocytophaga sputigena TaxID=1019 RepID=UPI0028D39101|nr:leucine-rich repeat domain-containing protein [Capnocytophaga sputigena]